MKELSQGIRREKKPRLRRKKEEKVAQLNTENMTGRKKKGIKNLFLCIINKPHVPP